MENSGRRQSNPNSTLNNEPSPFLNQFSFKLLNYKTHELEMLGIAIICLPNFWKLLCKVACFVYQFVLWKYLALKTFQKGTIAWNCKKNRYLNLIKVVELLEHNKNALFVENRSSGFWEKLRKLKNLFCKLSLLGWLILNKKGYRLLHFPKL